MIRIVIVFKKEEDRKLISGLLAVHSDFQIIRTGIDEYDAYKTAMDLKPDIIIMDYHLPGKDAPDLAPLIKRKSPSTSLIVICSSGEENLSIKSVKAGISGFLLKEPDIHKLPVLVKAVFYCGYYISTQVIYQVFSAFSELDSLPGSQTDYFDFQNERKRIFQKFSPTERRIMAFLALGYSDIESAEQLHLTEGTVRNYLTAIRHKTGLRSRSQITVYALIYGLASLNKSSLYTAIHRLKPRGGWERGIYSVGQ